MLLPSCAARSAARGLAGASEEQRALAGVVRERCCPLELLARLVETAELRQQVAPNGRQQVVSAQRGLLTERVDGGCKVADGRADGSPFQ